MTPSTAVRVVIAAWNERSRIEETVVAARAIGGVDEVVVVDDGSSDGTGDAARTAGARVLRPPMRLGKGGAVEGALARVGHAPITLLLDADLGATAKEAEALVDVVRQGRADIAIARLPRQRAHGGFRIVKGCARLAVRILAGFRAEEPLSGQRALTAQALSAVRPLARGFALETAMTIDAVRAGLRVVEVPVPMTHAATGRDLAGVVHRARQGLAVLRAAATRVVRR